MKADREITNKDILGKVCKNKNCNRTVPTINHSFCSICRGKTHSKAVARQRAAFLKYRNKLKSKGCCVCGHAACFKALEFHHLNNKGEISIGSTSSIGRIKKELSTYNIVLLCANCHRELHEGMIKEKPLFEKVFNRNEF